MCGASASSAYIYLACAANLKPAKPEKRESAFTQDVRRRIFLKMPYCSVPDGAEVGGSQESGSQHPAAVKVKFASGRTDDIAHHKRPDVKAIKRLRVQLYKKIAEIRRLRKENESLKEETQ
ncbi:hypothetical protein V5799_005625 [Amblyomma americanum]|uniref:Uncharacterized protein n=1 Tax=Amblyomma americanum TaxID=6943 RepID=A0AAQ4DYR2_AMBAM